MAEFTWILSNLTVLKNYPLLYKVWICNITSYMQWYVLDNNIEDKTRNSPLESACTLANANREDV